MSSSIQRVARMATVVALAVTVAGCGAGASPSPSPTPTAAPIDLTAIVVSEETIPSGLRIDNTGVGRPVLTHKVISGRAPQFLALEGFVGGRYTEMSGDPGVLLSLALDFDSEEHAHAAFALFLDELRSEQGYAAYGGAPAELGDEGTCEEFDNPAMGGLHESACLWRNGRLMLIVGGTLDRAAIHDVAEGMDERAP